VEDLLDNPVYHALISRDAPFGSGNENVRFFDEEVSPFAGIRNGYEKGFEDLYQLLPPARKILYATTQSVKEPAGWQFLAEIKGLQFVFDGKEIAGYNSLSLVPLTKEYAEEMVQLAALTRPGPFNMRTIEFGYYHGIFDSGKLVAMTGQRLHVENYSEVSAVCTHPEHLGKGYAAALLQHQVNFICSQGEIPFLHVRADNDRAIALYDRLGFKLRGPMNFYFMKKN
jgi:ribosomal protein S18 acetylase RimI-like enzyme